MMIPTSSMPACGHRLDAVEEHGLVGDRHELLGARVRDRAQARALAPREDQSLECLHGAREPSGQRRACGVTRSPSSCRSAARHAPSRPAAAIKQTRRQATGGSLAKGATRSRSKTCRGYGLEVERAHRIADWGGVTARGARRSSQNSDALARTLLAAARQLEAAAPTPWCCGLGLATPACWASASQSQPAAHDRSTSQPLAPGRRYTPAAQPRR